MPLMDLPPKALLALEALLAVGTWSNGLAMLAAGVTGHLRCEVRRRALASPRAILPLSYPSASPSPLPYANWQPTRRRREPDAALPTRPRGHRALRLPRAAADLRADDAGGAGAGCGGPRARGPGRRRSKARLSLPTLPCHFLYQLSVLSVILEKKTSKSSHNSKRMRSACTSWRLVQGGGRRGPATAMHWEAASTPCLQALFHSSAAFPFRKLRSARHQPCQVSEMHRCSPPKQHDLGTIPSPDHTYD